MDKNKIMVAFLLGCPTFQTSSLFFNFAEAKDDVSVFIKDADKKLKTYIDGSVLRAYTFSIISCKSVTQNAIISAATDENIESLAEVQAIIDWINQEAEERRFPLFDTNCIVDEMQCLTDDPGLYSVDASVDPPLAKYTITIQIQYLDKSKMIFT